MPTIYRGAKIVLVWLNHTEQDTALAMLVMSWLEKQEAAIDCDHGLATASRTVKSNFAQLLRVQRHFEKAYSTAELQLGTEYGVTTTELQTFKQLYYILEEVVAEVRKKDKPASEHLLQFQLLVKDLKSLWPPDHPFWSSFQALWSDEWFQRVWTLQEISLAENAAVLCGSSNVSWQWMKTLHDNWV